MDVVVIGCGASGVAALRKLHDAGLKVLGLEAADRIGGRINTVPFGETVADTGAIWCHGQKDNKVFELANPHGLIETDEPSNNWFMLSNGELVPNDNGEKILNALNDAVEKADKDNKKSVSECIRSAAKSDQTLNKNPQLTNSFVEWYERNTHVGTPSDLRKSKSLRGLAERVTCAGSFWQTWKARGYITLFDLLLNRYPDPSKEIPVQIQLNKEVETIKWKTDGGDNNALVQIKCKDGSLYTAKSVIVTVSVGVLKERHNQLFNPPLPKEKVNTINNLDFAVLDKIYIEFTKPWWPKTPAKFTILWREEDKAKFSDKDKWITEIYGLQTANYQPNVLLAWICGEGAEKMEKVSDEDLKAGMEKILNLFKQFNVTPIKNILRSKWASDPLTRGAYAYRSVITVENGGSAISLSEPLYNGDTPVVCFAGEATSHHQHSDVHGAVESGFREAERLIKKLK